MGLMPQIGIYTRFRGVYKRTSSCGCSYKEGEESIRKIFLKVVMSEVSLEEGMGTAQAIGGKRAQ